MLIILMLIGQTAYISQAPLFPKQQKHYEYSYLLLDLLFILLVVLGLTHKVTISEGTLTFIGLLVYLPAFIKILKKSSVRS